MFDDFVRPVLDHLPRQAGHTWGVATPSVLAGRSELVERWWCCEGFLNVLPDRDFRIW